MLLSWAYHFYFFDNQIASHIAAHFTFLFGLPSLVIFFVSGALHDFSGYMAARLFEGVICYFVLYLFHYRPAFCTSDLPRLETAKEAYDRKQQELVEKCRQAQLSNFTLTLVFYVFEKSSGMDGKSRPFAPHSPEDLDPSSPIFNEPSSPDPIDPQEILNFILLYQFHKYYTKIFYKGSSTNGIWGTILVNFPSIHSILIK